MSHRLLDGAQRGSLLENCLLPVCSGQLAGRARLRICVSAMQTRAYNPTSGYLCMPVAHHAQQPVINNVYSEGCPLHATSCPYTNPVRRA